MKITLILKADIGAKKQFLADLKRLQRNFPDAQIEVLESIYAGHSIELARSACVHSDYIVSVGGDGTFNEVLNGYMRYQAKQDAPATPVFGLLAYGTGNDFLRAVGLEGSMEELCCLLQAKSTRIIDVGRVSCQPAPGKWVQRYFHNVADVGIGASVVERMHRAGKRVGGGFGYLGALFRTFFSFRHVALSVNSESGVHWRGDALIVVAANGNYFGSGLCVAPGARVDDGRFYVTLVGKAWAWDFLMNYSRLRKGIPLDHPEARYFTARKLTIDTEPGAAAVEADGEFLGYTPAVIELLDQQLRLLSPTVEQPLSSKSLASGRGQLTFKAD